MQNYLDLYCARADYEGLPVEFLKMTGRNRWWLVMKFFAPAIAWFNDDALGLQALPVSSFRDYNIAGFPTRWRAFAVNGKQYDLDEANSVLMFNDPAMSVPYIKLLYNVDLMLECDKTHAQNIKAQRQPLILEIDEDEKKSADTFMHKLADDDTIMVRKRSNLADKKGVTSMKTPYNTQAFNTGRAFEGDKLASTYRYFDNRNLTMLGYDNENVEKKERLLVDEVNANNIVVSTFYTQALACEQEAFDEINKRWGYNIKVIPRRLKKQNEGVENDKQYTDVSEKTNA